MHAEGRFAVRVSQPSPSALAARLRRAAVRDVHPVGHRPPKQT